MTVTYSLNVANARLTGFTKLLLRWKGSIYKLLYREVIIFCGLYYMLSMSYRYLLNDKQKLVFEKVVEYCRTFTSVIPLSFVLGFYVSIVVTRWWQQFMQIPWPDKAVLLISGYVRGDDERGRIIRRTLARYLVLMQVLTFQAVSTSVRRRFPTLDHIQAVGLFTAEERLAYDEIIGTHGKWWAPAQWFISLIIRARRAGRIKHDYLMDKIIEELHVYRTCCGMMFAYDWISIPLVYTQTVSIATYMYFAAAIIGRQYLDHREGQLTTSNDVDYYIPVFTILEFLCFMGWLKVAEQLINPYGEDDDDFELNWCLDRNLLVSYTIVDEMYNKHPKLVQDLFWDKREPILPYTKSSINTKLNNVHPHLGSTVNLAVEPEDFLPMETIMEEDHEDYSYSSPPTTSMVDYGNTQPSWFQPHHSVQIQMDPTEQQPPNDHLKNPTKTKPNLDKNSNVSRNHSELIEGLRAESNPSSRSTSRNAMRFIPDFIQDSKLVNRLFGSHSNSSQNSNLNTSLHQNHYQNYSNLKRQFSAQHHQNTFLLKTPTKKLRQPHTASILNDSTGTSDVSKMRSNQNQSILVNNNTPFSMNASSNASIGGNLNTMNNINNFNTSLSATTMNHSQHLNGSNQNLVNSISAASKARLQSNRKLETDDLTSSNNDQRYETANRTLRNLRLNRASTLNNAQSTKYSNLPTAPVLPTFGSSSASKTSRMSPLMNRLRNSFNFTSHHYRNLNKLSSRNKLRNSFSSAVSLKSKCDNPTSDQLVTPNGFHFPQAYVPPKNPNQYLPLHLRKSQESTSTLSLDQEKELNNNLNNALNLNKNNQNDVIDIKISPASRASHRNLNLSNEQQLLSNVDEEENLIVMDDLSSNKDLSKELTDKDKDERDQKDDESKMHSSNSNYTISTAVAILNSSNENELNKLKSSVKPNINNQDSQPLTSDTLTENHSKSSSTHSSLTELNQEEVHDETNENQSLLNKNNETETSSSSNEATTQQKQQEEMIKNDDAEEDEENEDDKSYSPNEEPNEERYLESPTSSNDSLSPYESNQNTISSYTQLLEKDKK